MGVRTIQAALTRAMQTLLTQLTRGERAGLGVLLTVAVALVGLTFRLGLDFQVVIWALLWFSGLAIVLRRFWTGLFGPVFLFDLVRTSRNSPIFSLRVLYGGALLVILYLLYVTWFGGAAGYPWELETQVRLPIKSTARFAQAFFHTYVGVQLAAVLLITPLAVSGAVAEEKEKRTLAFLLATDLRDHEIVLGKLASRLTHLSLFLLTGLPILTLLQFLGGMDPNLVLASFIANGMTMLGLAAVSIVCSVYAERPLSAMIYAYLGAAAYLLMGCICVSPFVAVFGVTRGAAFEDLEEYAPLILALVTFLLNALVVAVCCRAAIVNLRRRYRLHAPPMRELILDDEPTPPVKTTLPEMPARPVDEVFEERELSARNRPRYVPKPHPKIGHDPMLWKELYIDQGLGLPESLRALGQVPLIVGVVLLAYLILVCGLQGLLDQGGTGNGAREFTQGVVRFLGTMILCLMLLGVALRAAHCISTERDRRTLDSLLTTVLEDREILRAKWWSSLLYVRKGWWFLGLTWFLGLFTLGLHALAIPLLVFAWVMYAVFAAGLGLWFSLVSPTTLRSTLGTFFSLLAASLAPWATWTFVEALVRYFALDYRYPWLMGFDPGLLVPPVVLVRLAFPGDYAAGKLPFSAGQVWIMLTGMYCYGLLGAALWSSSCARFGALAGRMPYGKRAAAEKAGTKPG